MKKDFIYAALAVALVLMCYVWAGNDDIRVRAASKPNIAEMRERADNLARERDDRAAMALFGFKR